MSDLPGIHGTVAALVEWDPDGPGPRPPVLVAGGLFGEAGTLAVHNVAAWDGSQWSSIGDGLSEGRAGVGVTGLLVDHGTLIACGSDLQDSRGNPPGSVVWWDGQSWQPLGEVHGLCTAIGSYNGRIVVGGYIWTPQNEAVGQVVAWNGTTWDTLGVLAEGGDFGAPSSLISAPDGLIMGGWFDAVNGEQTRGLARWDGSAWHDYAPPIGKSCQSATLYNGEVVALMMELLPNYDFVMHAFQLHQGSWREMPPPMPDGFPMTVASVGGQLYATDWSSNGGTFGGPPLQSVVRWDGTGWQPMGEDIDAVSCFALFRGTLIGGGGISRCDSTAAQGVAAWAGDHWRPLGKGISGFIWQLVQFRGDLLASGEFWSTASPGALPLRWDGASWVRALPFDLDMTSWYAEFNNDLIIGTPAGLERYDGVALTPIGPPSAGSSSPIVVDGVLYSLSNDDASIERGVYRLDASGWTRLGGQFTGNINGLIGHGGGLYAYGGGFTNAEGSIMYGLVRWTGAQWEQVGPWPGELHYPSVYAAAALGDELIVAVDAFLTGDKLASWDGTSWRLLPRPPSSSWLSMTPYTMCSDGHEVFAGGSGSDIVAWDGRRWRIAGVMDTWWSYVSSLMVVGDDLIAAGNFGGINGHVANMVARIRIAPCCGSADFDNDGESGTDADIRAFFACIAGDCCAECGSADFNGDGDSATDADIEAFFRVLAGGSC
jgi:hypothetical protein